MLPFIEYIKIPDKFFFQEFPDEVPITNLKFPGHTHSHIWILKNHATKENWTFLDSSISQLLNGMNLLLSLVTQAKLEAH